MTIAVIVAVALWLGILISLYLGALAGLLRRRFNGTLQLTTPRLQRALRELLALPAHRIARAGVARTYQIPRPFAHLTVRDNVALTAMFGGTALDRRHAAVLDPGSEAVAVSARIVATRGPDDRAHHGGEDQQRRVHVHHRE